MMEAELILVIISALYVIVYSTLLANLTSLIVPSHSELNTENLLEISIVVAAKNEVQNLNRLIPVINSLQYPEDRFELIIVDDQSEDGTYESAKKLCSDFKNYFVTKAVNKKFEGKRGALEIGISQSKYPFILITDADCVPETNWLVSASEKFNEGYDFIFGIAPFYQTKNIVNKVTCYENFKNSILAFAVVILHLTYMASARNFGFKKEAFLKIDGYKNTTDTISGDDDLLIREAVKRKMKIGTITSPGSFVYSDTKTSFKDYFSQRARHTQTSFHYPMKQKIFLSIWHLLNIFFLISPILIFIDIVFIIPFLIKMLFDIIVCKVNQKKFGYRFSIFESIYLQFIYEMFLIIHIIRSRITEIKWK